VVSWLSAAERAKRIEEDVDHWWQIKIVEAAERLAEMRPWSRPLNTNQAANRLKATAVTLATAIRASTPGSSTGRRVWAKNSVAS
jgi:hypothetical protein